LDKHLNIVAFDNPYPPTYGGVIDVYYKLIALAKQGVKIHLHYYSNKKDIALELKNICEEIFIYKRETGLTKHFSKYPYIILSRSSEELIKNLAKNNYPILFEGLHTTYPIFKINSIQKRSIIRHHNIEHDYYLGLYKSEKNILHRLYYLIESFKLKSHLNKVKDATCHLTISDADAEKLITFGFKNIKVIPPFHSFENENWEENRQDTEPYVLYHGNLNVVENLVAAEYLIDHVFNDTTIKYVIAGSSKDNYLKKRVKSNIEIIENPTKEEINKLIANARVIALPTFQSTGVKLKLIDSLFKGQHVIVNESMIASFPTPELTLLAKTTEEMKALIKEYLSKPFTSEEKQNRIQKLNLHFNNKKNAEQIIEVTDKLLG
jgi:glycosyltransferase involved in cell wall biosynthesis